MKRKTPTGRGKRVDVQVTNVIDCHHRSAAAGGKKPPSLKVDEKKRSATRSGRLLHATASGNQGDGITWTTNSDGSRGSSDSPDVS